MQEILDSFLVGLYNKSPIDSFYCMSMDNNTNSSYHHILKYTSLFGSIQALNIFIGLVRNKLVALILGPGGIGLMSLFNSVECHQLRDCHQLGQDLVGAVRER